MLGIHFTSRKMCGRACSTNQGAQGAISQLLQLVHQGTYKYLMANYNECSPKLKNARDKFYHQKRAWSCIYHQLGSLFPSYYSQFTRVPINILKPIIMKGHLNEKCQEYILPQEKSVVVHLPPSLWCIQGRKFTILRPFLP